MRTPTAPAKQSSGARKAQPPRAPVPSALDSFEALDATHREVVDVLRQFEQLMMLLQDGIDGPDVRDLARDICRFFDGTAQQHHADEERVVFPSLLASGNTDLVQQVQRLQQDHGWLEADWRELRPQLASIAEDSGFVDIDLLQHGATVFAALYRDHIELEESLIYPEARRRYSLEEKGRKARAARGMK